MLNDRVVAGVWGEKAGVRDITELRHRIHRGDHVFGFWEDESQRLQSLVGLEIARDSDTIKLGTMRG